MKKLIDLLAESAISRMGDARIELFNHPILPNKSSGVSPGTIIGLSMSEGSTQLDQLIVALDDGRRLAVSVSDYLKTFRYQREGIKTVLSDEGRNQPHRYTAHGKSLSRLGDIVNDDHAFTVAFKTYPHHAKWEMIKTAPHVNVICKYGYDRRFHVEADTRRGKFSINVPESYLSPTHNGMSINDLPFSPGAAVGDNIGTRTKSFIKEHCPQSTFLAFGDAENDELDSHYLITSSFFNGGGKLYLNTWGGWDKNKDDAMLIQKSNQDPSSVWRDFLDDYHVTGTRPSHVTGARPSRNERYIDFECLNDNEQVMNALSM